MMSSWGIIFSLFFLLFCNSEAVVTIDIYAAKYLLGQGYGYLDVRTTQEFSNGYVENAVNVPYRFNTTAGSVKNPKFVEQVLSFFRKDDHFIVGCQTGLRSFYASTDLVDAGFKHIKNMDGGYEAWVENGFPVIKP